MESEPWLIFDLDGALFGVDARRVRESVRLPELTPVEEAPPWIVGLFNLRGLIIPVADLHLRFGRRARPYRPDDQVVVVEGDRQPLGVIVSEVREVASLAGAAIQSPPQFDPAAGGPPHLVAGEAQLGDDLVALLDLSLLTRLPADSAPGEAEAGPYFCPQATPEARALFRTRALALSEPVGDDAGEGLALAVLGLNGEYFGVELAAVQEFCDIVHLSPIPCCPSHILGAINLRGDLFTLLDPRPVLNLPPAGRGGKAVVARLAGQAVGIAVDEVHEVAYLRAGQLQPPPPALRARSGAEVTGTAPYAGRMMTVLDLPALLAREEWIVDESV